MADAQSPNSDATGAYVLEDMGSYRDGFKNLMIMVKLLGLLMVAGTGFVYYYISTFVPQDSYFAVSPGGAQRRMVGLPLPNVNRDAILRWGAAATTEVMTFGFHDIDERMTRARRLFSDEGWRSFSEALAKARALKAMIAQQHIMTAIPTAPPSILAEGIFNGDYSWIIEVPTILTVRAGSEVRIIRTRIRLIVIRLPTASNPMGIGIKTFLAL